LGEGLGARAKNLKNRAIHGILIPDKEPLLKNEQLALGKIPKKKKGRKS